MGSGARKSFRPVGSWDRWVRSRKMNTNLVFCRVTSSLRQENSTLLGLKSEEEALLNFLEVV